MNRNDEFKAMMEELDRPAPGLETTLDRACKRRKRTANMILRPVTGFAACFVCFVLLVNFCTPVAHACAQIPVLRELAEAVTLSPSLRDAVEHDYVQQMDLTQTQNDITAQVDYLIVDQKQVNVFYRLDSHKYRELAADPTVKHSSGEGSPSCSWHSGEFDAENGQLRRLSIDFTEEDVPGSLLIQLEVYTNEVAYEDAAAEGDTDDYERPDYLADFTFLLEFDPRFTASGKVYPVNQRVTLEGQSITITDIQVYPTHMRVNIEEAEDNTAWLKDLEFYIETDRGRKFQPVSNGISATGSVDSPSMVSYRAESTYFYQAEQLDVVITGAKWLRKDMETTCLDLSTGAHGTLPEGVEFHSAKKQDDGWVVTFRADWESGEPMYDIFGSKFFDADGNEYEIHRWSGRYGDEDGEGKVTYFYEEFPLKNYPYDQVWLTPRYSHHWTAENEIVIAVK